MITYSHLSFLDLRRAKVTISGEKFVSSPSGMQQKGNPAECERYFQYTIYLVLRMISFYTVFIEKEQSQGRVDCIVEVPEYVYIFEFKLDGSAQEALRQILRIFIKNSITYSHQPASVTLRWNGETRQLSVADQGWGIAESDLGRIFDRFYRVDESRNRTSGGTGLGLSIARTLVDRLDLELEVQSLVGQGTTMFLKFPH